MYLPIIVACYILEDQRETQGINDKYSIRVISDALGE